MPLSLVYHAGALGDFITTLPAMSVWRRLHPEDRLVLLGRRRHAQLAPEGMFDEAWDAGSSSFAPLFGAALDPGSLLRRKLSVFDSALLFCAASSRLPANLDRLGVGGLLSQDPFPPAGVHGVDYHLSLFAGELLTEEDRLPRVRLGRGSLEAPSGAVALHPGSGDPRKNWPFEAFRGLAVELARAGFVVRWILGPAEEGLELPAGARAWRRAPLEEMAAALSMCGLFVGNDSGIAHLAAAAGCPTIALFGATDPVRWAPRGRMVRVMRAPGGDLSALRMETVLAGCLACLRG